MLQLPCCVVKCVKNPKRFVPFIQVSPSTNFGSTPSVHSAEMSNHTFLQICGGYMSNHTPFHPRHSPLPSPIHAPFGSVF